MAYGDRKQGEIFRDVEPEDQLTGFSSGPLTAGRAGLGLIGLLPAEENIMPFKNRSEAGRRLAVALAGYKEHGAAAWWGCRRGGGCCGELDAQLDLKRHHPYTTRYIPCTVQIFLGI